MSVFFEFIFSVISVISTFFLQTSHLIYTSYGVAGLIISEYVLFISLGLRIFVGKWFL